MNVFTEIQALFGVVQVRLKLEFDNWFIFEKHYNALFTKSFLHVYVYLKHFIFFCAIIKWNAYNEQFSHTLL